MVSKAGRVGVALAMGEAVARRQFGGGELDGLADDAEVLPDVITDFTDPDAGSRLAEVDILLTSWGCPNIDAATLERMLKLAAVVHAAGSVKAVVGEAVWDQNIPVCSMADLNAVPVAEYTVAMILLENKRVLPAAREYRQVGSFPGAPDSVGNYRKRIGLISASKIGRRVAELLRPFDLDVVIADPFCPTDEITALGATKVSLEELFARSNIVSLHAPLLPATIGMIDASLLSRMPDGSTLINTARGKIVDHDALLGELRTGRMRAVLDVTDPEPLPADSPFWQLPNVVLTPHLAGSQGTELGRMSAAAISEINRLIAGQPLKFRVPPERRDLLA